MRCRLIACTYEASGSLAGSMAEHLATVHGIGRAEEAASFLGCPFVRCSFEAKGSERYAALQMRGHMLIEHGIDPKNPELPAEVRGVRR